MFGRKLKLFTLFGFEVSLDASWLIIFALVAWSLASGLFPEYYPDLGRKTYWVMGVIGAIGLFASIVFHEFWHSSVARKNGMPMKGITLFIFGGVAEMNDEPPSAGTEFKMAVAGPLASVVLGAAFYGVTHLGDSLQWSTPVVGVLNYLGFINLILAAFNLAPAFPLDGGRVLRSALWAWKKDLRWATRIASSVGGGFGLALIVLGVINIIHGAFIGGLWWFLIGMFLRGVAQAANQRVQARETLKGEPLKRFMKENPVVAPPDISVSEFVDEYVYRYHFKMFPVVEGDQLIGCVSTKQLKELDREQWEQTPVGRLAQDCSEENTISPDAEAVEALQAMQRTGASRLMVIDNGRLVGVVALKDLLEFLNLKLELNA